jgi:hypothetical protein
MKKVLIMRNRIAKETKKSKIRIGNIELDVVVLDNGERVISEESLNKFISALTDLTNYDVLKDTSIVLKLKHLLDEYKITYYEK